MDFSDRILLVDDETRILLSFSVMLKSAGFNDVVTLEDSREVIPFLEKHPVSLVVLDLIMPFMRGQDVLAAIEEKFPHIPVIVMTASNEIDTAVECMKSGAVDYLVKPVERNRFLTAVRRALETRQLEAEVSSLKRSLLSDQPENPGLFAPIVTINKQMIVIFKYLEAITHSPQAVLITGETGVGKELIARSLHRCGGGRGPFVAVNAAGLDDAMFSDTLFGHKKGAFTGAGAVREGLIAQASGGTLFLDEIGDLQNASQVKLLRLIQEREYYPLGADTPKKTDARIVVATNRDLQQALEQGLFRKDLYFRLSYHHVHVPPLRERKEDIPVLLEHFIKKASASLGRKAPTPPQQLSALLKAYDFPGNVRELESLVYDAVSQHTGGVLSMESFKNIVGAKQASDNDDTMEPVSGVDGEAMLENIFGRFPSLKQMETFLVDEALKRSGGNQGTAAVYLGISRQALNKRLSRKKD